jgi:hypothetical protein
MPVARPRFGDMLPAIDVLLRTGDLARGDAAAPAQAA